jgi:aspartate racemase
MDLIDRIKAGDQNEAVSGAMQQLASALVSRGAQVVIAACTEIPLVLDETMMRVPLVSSTDVLAQRTVQLAQGDLPLTDRE